jgi:hypothetical protein
MDLGPEWQLPMAAGYWLPAGAKVAKSLRFPTKSSTKDNSAPQGQAFFIE